MMADAVKYVVMCNCDDEPGALIIAWIDDERPAGGHIQMRSNTRFTETQWGRHIEWKLECRACRKYAPISEMTAAAILDGFGAKLHELRTSTIPDADDPSIAEARHVIPFSALCLRLSQLGGYIFRCAHVRVPVAESRVDGLSRDRKARHGRRSPVVTAVHHDQ